MQDMFLQNPTYDSAIFFNQYFVGPRVQIVTRRCCCGNYTCCEWMRVWQFKPGMSFAIHAPPRIKNGQLKCFSHEETEKAGLVFKHYAYATEAFALWKQYFYLRENTAIDDWRRLQQNTTWPARLKDFLPWLCPRDQSVQSLVDQTNFPYQPIPFID